LVVKKALSRRAQLPYLRRSANRGRASIGFEPGHNGHYRFHTPGTLRAVGARPRVPVLPDSTRQVLGNSTDQVAPPMRLKFHYDRLSHEALDRSRALASFWHLSAVQNSTRTAIRMLQSCSSMLINATLSPINRMLESKGVP
jgi:hypothetical protein